MPPLPDAVVAMLKTDACAALAAIMVVSNAHSELLAWAQRALSPLNVIGREGAVPSDAAQNSEPKPNGCRPGKPRREAAKLDVAAYQARRIAQRDADDERLIEAMRLAPGASIREWGGALGKSRTAIVQGLHRLRDAGLIENADGVWALVDPQPAATAAAPPRALVGRPRSSPCGRRARAR